MCVVGNDTEARVHSVLFHDPSQRHLGRVGHGIRLIQDDELVPGRGRGSPRRLGAAAHGEDLLRAGKRLDLFPHHVDATVVGGVEFQHHLPHVGGAVDPPRERQDGRGLARAGGPVEEEMWQAVGVDEFVNGREDVLVARDVGEGRWAILFHPDSLSDCAAT